MQHLTLYELQLQIKDSLINAFPLPVWITAEISEIKVNYSGHCYLELVEKDGADGVKVKAKVSANIWANKFRLIKTYFESTTGIALDEGIKVLLKVDVRFHELYGLSLNVVDIDPAYTVGEMKLQRNLIVQRLMDEGIIDLNKELEMSIVPQRIAVISSATAAGFQDFLNHLKGNAFGYRFNVDLFTSVMQGNEAEASVISSLEKIYANIEEYDAVAIIRGGGSQTDLVCFDSYLLAASVAQFPIPVLTGIGHDKDESVTDIVAFSSFKTPTAVAAFLVDSVAEFEGELSRLTVAMGHHARRHIQDRHIFTLNLEHLLLDSVRVKLSSAGTSLDSVAYRLSRGVLGQMSGQQRLFNTFVHKIGASVQKVLRRGEAILQENLSAVQMQSRLNIKMLEHQLESLELRLDAANPYEILKKGYSITLHDGKRVRDITMLKGEEIETIVESGSLISEVKEFKKKS